MNSLMLSKHQMCTVFAGSIFMLCVYEAARRTNDMVRPRATYPPMKVERRESASHVVSSVHIMDTVGLGLYLWREILHGEIVAKADTNWYDADLTVANINLRYSLTCCHWQAKDMPDMDDENVILILWGRSTGRQHSANWIQQLLGRGKIKNLALLFWSDLDCKDDWLRPLLDRYDVIRYVYMTHESNLIDSERVFLWPLGIGVFLDVPFVPPEQLDLTSPRNFTTNFLGALKDRDNRKNFAKVLLENPMFKDSPRHLVSDRQRGPPYETVATSERYRAILRSSDLTLSPVGAAPECHRTFEALERGSIPVIEDSASSSCSEHSSARYRNTSAPYRLFKLHRAPVIYVRNWEKELPEVVRRWEGKSRDEKAAARRRVVTWYVEFKAKMREKFVADIKSRFVA